MSNAFFAKTGPMTIGSRLRQSSDRLTSEAVSIYKVYGVAVEPRWFPIIYSLAQEDGQTVAQLATTIGHSQASVSQIIKDMHQRGYVQLAKQFDDARKTVVALSDEAKAVLPALNQQMDDVRAAVDGLLADMHHNVWLALDELDYLLDQQSLLDRVRQVRKGRERQQVEIVPFTSTDAEAFRQLNHEWINTYFALEDSDHAVLDHPQTTIIDRGGFIFMALYGGKPVGTCALVRHGAGIYELSKMAVTPAAQGKHVGWLLGQAVLQKAGDAGATTVFLESNTVLKPAIQLYQKLGFVRVPGTSSAYQRTNIRMELTL